MTKTILITGGTGTVAKVAGEYLCSKGYQVIGISRSIEKEHSCYSQTHQIDLLEPEDLKKLEKILKTNSVDAVFHLAWNIPAENFDTHTAWKGNMEMFENTLESAEKANVPTFINGSSIHAGTGNIPAYTVEASLENTPQPYRDSIDPDNDFDLRKEQPEKLLSPLSEDPDSPYGWSKVMTERAVRESVEKGDFELGINIRIGGVNSENYSELEGEPYYSSLYWSHKDLGRTLSNILESDQKGLHQFYGVSDNKGRIFNIENSFISNKK